MKNTCTHTAFVNTHPGSTTRRWMALILCLTLLFGTLAAVPAAASSEPASEPSDQTVREPLSAADIYEKTVNSMVGVNGTTTVNYWGYETAAAVSGSGFILTEDGYILTNQHVIDSTEAITVTLYNGDSYDAELIGYDETNDIAILKVDASGLVPVTIGDSNDLRVGDEVLAIGNPLGELTFSLTGGRISALNREVTTSNGVRMNLIQTDCAINSGNSGGALFNMYGEVIGITNGKYSGNGMSTSIDNLGFAIPISNVIHIVYSIIDDGVISKPYIGVSIADVEEEALSYGLPSGASIKEVVEDGPADKAGLKVNDIITAINGTEVKGRRDVSSMVTASAPGDILTITVYRQGESMDIDVEVEENTQSALPEEDPAAEDQSGNNSSDDPLDVPPEGQENDQGGDSSLPDDMLDLFDEFMRRYGGRGA